MEGTNPKREQSWDLEIEARNRIFQGANFFLGQKHIIDGKDEDCGPNCASRLRSISCPFFQPTVPCLVGCEIQYNKGVPGDGLGYESQSIRVTAQAGSYLLGEETVINIGNGGQNFIRILKDKRGNEVRAVGPLDNATLFEDMEEGVFIQEVDLGEEVEKSAVPDEVSDRQ